MQPGETDVTGCETDIPPSGSRCARPDDGMHLRLRSPLTAGHAGRKSGWRLARCRGNSRESGAGHPRMARGAPAHHIVKTPGQSGGAGGQASMKVFFDIDTQLDFLVPGGALYGPGAENLIPAIASLNRYAGEHGIPLVSTTDAHPENAREFREWPPHCVTGTFGQ